MLGSGALSGKMLLVRTVENDKIYAYFRAALPHRVRKVIRIEPYRVRAPQRG